MYLEEEEEEEDIVQDQISEIIGEWKQYTLHFLFFISTPFFGKAFGVLIFKPFKA